MKAASDTPFQGASGRCPSGGNQPEYAGPVTRSGMWSESDGL